MRKRYYALIVALVLVSSLFLGITSLRPSEANASPQQYPIMDQVADTIIQKYQPSTSEQLWIKKSEKAPPTAEEQRTSAFLKSDPQMHAAFINPPIATKCSIAG